MVFGACCPPLLTQRGYFGVNVFWQRETIKKA